MKKGRPKKLALRRETLKEMQTEDLKQVEGGCTMQCNASACIQCPFLG